STYTWDYDRFGNRWHQYIDGFTMSSLIFDNKNHIGTSGYAYDSAGSGNLANDGFHTYSWDAENRLATLDSTGASHSYDPLGRRVQKTTGGASVQYLYDLQGNATEEMNGSTLNRAEIFLGGRHLGSYASGNTYLSHTDMQGTERARTLMNNPGTAS